jgi:AcrR family transcriptional regulator
MTSKKSLARARPLAKVRGGEEAPATGKARSRPRNAKVARSTAAASAAVSSSNAEGAGGAAPAEKPRVRDRILETAGELFYSRGIHCVGVDSIASEAGTNKMSLYRNFPSKEELVAEYLREQEREYWALWDATIEPFAGNPRRQLEALFDGFLTRAKSKDDERDECKVRRGCALGNAAVEIPEDDENLRAIVLAYKSELRRRLRKLCKDAGASDADALGDALMLLAEGGCYTLSTFPGTSGPIASMAKAARALIRAHLI